MFTNSSTGNGFVQPFCYPFQKDFYAIEAALGRVIPDFI